MIKLFPHQAEAEMLIKRNYLQGSIMPLYVLPTGGGKTVLFTDIAMKAMQKGSAALILVHKKDLIRQASATLRQFGVRHGIINAEYNADYSCKVQVASIGTIINRLGKIPIDFKLIIADECHHATSPTWRKVIDYYLAKGAKGLGVTATPCRGDGKGLGVQSGGLFDSLIVGPSIYELTKMGRLTPLRVFMPKSHIDFSEVSMQGGDLNRKQLSKATDKPKITGDAIKEYRRVCELEGRKVPAIAFCVDIKHSENVASEFSSAGFRAFAVHGKMQTEDVVRILKGLGNGSVDVVASCDMIGEGTDVPAVSCAIMLRRTMSMGLYLQQAGRALRVADGKKWAYLIDHVSNSMQHREAFMFLVSDYKIEWSLDGEMKSKRKRKDDDAIPAPVQCPSCYETHVRANVCPSCGHVYSVNKRQVIHEEGELKELTAADIEKLRIRKARKSEEAQADTLEKLYELAEKRGYKKGWAEHRHKARQARK